jgi:two-component system, OmpR family, phosphate regulon sensor histidine kinase PhoR
MVTITVADIGIGIPAGDQAKLFTRFFRASNAISRRIPRTGLGLAIVAGIVASHNGTIECSSTEGTGTTVTVRFPRHLPAGTDDAAPRPPMALPAAVPRG